MNNPFKKKNNTQDKIDFPSTNKLKSVPEAEKVPEVQPSHEKIVKESKKAESTEKTFKVLSSYQLNVNGLLVNIKIIFKKGDFVPEYNVSIANISQITQVVLDKIKEEFIRKIRIGDIDLSKSVDFDEIKNQFSEEIENLIRNHFPHIDDKTMAVLVNHLILENVGLGKIDIILKDPNLEEIAINSSKEPVWVYHRKHKWLKTNILIESEEKIRHYATMIGREIGKEITVLSPLMDAHLSTGDRVNATLQPISSFGNTITIRKFATKPWTITDFLKSNTIGYDAAALLWLAVENELSILITGGTGSGKTSMLNVISNFFPANQRIISIEDTREITLPKNLHWIPLETRLPNPEGKGEVTMLDLVVNSLRMRPDRVVVGEIRRKREAEVLFEAMHTGHSVYATLHANNADETVRRLVNPPIEVPRHMLSAISLICVQYRNRRTGERMTLQLAEVDSEGNADLIMQYNIARHEMNIIKKPRRLYDTIALYTGLTDSEIEDDLEAKKEILRWLVSKNINDVDRIGSIIARYYMRKYNQE